jgi:hypothetical protein
MIIYLARCLVENKVYIGQTVRPLSIRWSVHKSAARLGSKQKFHQAIRKYGSENFTIQEIARAANQEQLDYLEQYFIVLYSSDRFPFGYNRTMGGMEHFLKGNKHSLGRINSEETKRKMAASARASWTPERRSRLAARVAASIAMRPPKIKLPRKVRTYFPLLSAEHKAKISASLVGNKRRLGIPHSEEVRRKISQRNKGRKRIFTLQHCLNISKAKKGKKRFT